LHTGQLESGYTTDFFIGILEIQTLKKLPKTVPNKKIRK
jgi:hypothetical protein